MSSADSSTGKPVLEKARQNRLKSTKKPGRPKNPPKPSEFGPLMNMEEAGQCLGISYMQMRAAISYHNIPVMRIGKAVRIARSVVERILEAGEFEAGRVFKAGEEEEASEPVFGPDVRRSVRDAYLRGPVHGAARADGSGRRSAAVGSQA